jgi:hypothetical protein
MQNCERLLPAYPLFVKDPYFSIWSTSDTLNETDTTFWTGKTKKTYGLIKANGKTYCFLGDVKNVDKLTQTRIKVTSFRTIYYFACEEFELEVAFFSPTPIDNLEIWSCPVAYLEYTIIPKKKLTGVEVSLCLHQEWCYYSEKNEVRGDVFVLNGKDVAWFGLNKQHVFNRTADRVGSEWGYYYLMADSCFYHSINDFSDIAVCEYETDVSKTKYLTGQNLHGDIQERTSGKILVAFDDIISINYYGEMLRGYYFSDGKNIVDALRFSFEEYERVCEACAQAEKEIVEESKVYGEEYLAVLNASYRQTLAAHKLVKDGKGRLLCISKECGSGGCVATVDVTYPTMPIFLLYRPELVRASIEPIFDFAKMDAWEYEFAPHDAGMYPFCNGQFYGVKNKPEGKYGRNISYQGPDIRSTVLPQYYTYPKGSDLYDYNRQMPIEECADMILICSFYLACGGDEEYVKNEMPLLRQWCDYLVTKGLIPENQLCTDDFLKHMDKNVNLALKATVAIKAFANLEKKFGGNGDEYDKVAREWAEEFKKRFGGRAMALSFDEEGKTFSMKYNLAPVKLLGLDIFDKETIEREVQVCLEHNSEFGFPLDNRSNLTKCDWMMWIAAMSDSLDEQKKIIKSAYNYLINGVDRVPYADLYDCQTGTAEEFTNRTVLGSMFMLLLKQKMLGHA